MENGPFIVELDISMTNEVTLTPALRSNAIFICTANDTSTIDRPLLDRMEAM